MPLLVKTQRVMGWKTLLWCNQITDCPPIEAHRQRSARPFARSGLFASRVVAACSRERGYARGRREVPGTETRSRSMDGPVVPALLARLNPVSCDGSAPTRAEPCWRWQSEHAVAQRALRVIEGEANEALPHSVV